ncbi:hypothetical protein CPB84DRAFT_1841100 [Gymnopilus junonius]|uniref:XRRM domain-containing protein n=1 Tax=Gymnopilus junonius TaxID=109634 RepID=A0A9P5TVG1_GYMJU|nr:hypothetical protein CPB84DRAFT_1841100 [Gymnopilus junonius]
MSSFSFVPRSVKRRKIEAPTVQDQVSTKFVDLEGTPAGARTASEDHPPSKADPKTAQSGETLSDVASAPDRHSESDRTRVNTSRGIKKPKGVDLEDLAILIWLSLSDYALWADSDLRRRIDLGPQSHNHTEEEQTDNSYGQRGYIPLAYLRSHSAVFHAASSSANLIDQPESVYVKAIRTYASHLVDVRFIVSNDATLRGTNYWKQPSSSPIGYEVKRKIATNTLDNLGKSDWEKLTVYVENIPNQYRTLPGVAKLITSLLPASSEIRHTKVQSVSFPPHHNDKPGSVPIGKGFALVTLSDPKDCQFLLETWPWDVGQPKIKDETGRVQEPLEKEARKYGLRCLSRSRWEELKAEYLIYRQELVEELNVESAAQRKISTAISRIGPGQKSAPGPDRKPEDARKLESLEAPTIDPNSRFPPGCLVFVRNVHPETNKTTLRTLFSQACQATDGSPPASSADGLDYIDYLKGLDSCHIRLRSQAHAKHFVQYFSTHPTIQTAGLDGVGTLRSSPNQERVKSEGMIPELVLGKREELYWEKIPEKVRRQAVEKALSVLDGSEGRDNSATHEGTSNKRKNRRKSVAADMINGIASYSTFK